MKTFLIHTLMVLFLISGTHFVFADCPKEHLKAEASFSINEDDEAYIYGQASVSNLTYWPATVEEPSWAYISSDHSVVCYHYYENKTFTVYWAYRAALAVTPVSKLAVRWGQLKQID